MRGFFITTIFITLSHNARSGPTSENDVTPHGADQRKSGGSSSCGSDRWNRSERLDINAATEGPWGHSLYILIGHLRKMAFGRNRPRQPRHTLPQTESTFKSSMFDIQFQKCAEKVTGSEVPLMKLYLIVKNPKGRTDLSQLRIHDTISEIISLQTTGHIQGSLYQTFSKETLPAGSSYIATYNASVKGGWNEVLFLPAFLNFSNESQNDINLFSPAIFGPVVANFTMTINTTEKVCLDHPLHFAWFCVAFLISTLLLSITLLTSACCYIYCCTHTRKHSSRQRRSFSAEAEPEDAFCNTSESANEDAAFEDTVIDIMAMEDPQNMLQSLNKLEISTLVRASVTLECVRVQMLKGVFRVLTSAVGVSKREVGVLDLLSYVNDMEEDQQVGLTTHCSMEMHTHQQELEQQCLQRHKVLRRREELHSIISEELEEAMTGETHTASQILHQYYTCQEQLEAVLDLFIANQRAALSERQAQRRFLVQRLRDLQHSVCDVFSIFSQHIDSWFTQIHREGVLSDQQCMEQLEHAQLELMRAKHTLEERLKQERSSIHCDLIRLRRARISEMLCEQRCEQQESVCVTVCEGRLNEYLLQWQTFLCAHNTQLSELIINLDQEAAAQIRKVLVCVLHDAVADLKQIESMMCESLQEVGVPRRLLLQMRVGSVVGGAMAEAEATLAVREREVAKALRMTRSRIQPIRAQELQEQQKRRASVHTYFRSLCEGQCSLSERDLLRMQLECVKSECRLDRCLLLPHTLSTHQSTEHPSDPTHGHAPNDPCLTSADAQHACVCEDEVCLRGVCEERVAIQVASLQWEKMERRSRVLDTHSALLTLQTLLLQSVTDAPAGDELSHTIHTHCLALKEVELQLQKEESEWEESVNGCGYDKLLTHDEELFRVDTECSITECLQGALCKKEQLTHKLSERLRMEIRRQQVMEDLWEQHELKRLYTHCDQDLLLTAVLVKLSGVSVPVLQQLLRLLLPTVPEGELQSLMHTLIFNEGQTQVGSDLVETLRRDIISKNLLSSSHTHTDRMQKKKRRLQEKLFPSHPDDSTHSQQANQIAALATATKEDATAMVGGATSEEAGGADPPPACEVTEEERLFTICNTPTVNEEHTLCPHNADLPCASDTSHKSKKKRNFRFRKGTVAPLEQT